MAAPAFERRSARARPRYGRLGLLGLGLITAALGVLGVLVLMRFPEEAGFILPLLAISVVTTALVWFIEATWTRIVGTVVPLGLGLMLFWLAFGLMYPSSPFDFVPGVMFVLGVGLAVFGNAAAIIQRRRHHLDTVASPGERRAEEVVAAIVVLSVVASGLMAVLGRTSVPGEQAARAVPLDMAGFAFEPVAVDVSGGAGLLVSNRDPFMHDVAVPDLGIEAIDVAPGSDVLIDVPASPGTYTLYCTLHSDTGDPSPDADEQMVATLTVR